MDASFPYGDLIVFGAVAAFIVLRYRAMLGESRGRDPEILRRTNDEGAAPVILPSLTKEKAIKEAAEKMEEGLDASVRDGLNAIRSCDPGFNSDAFLSGARQAFDMVIDAFNARDRETLVMLLADNVYQNFDAVLREQAATERYAHTTLVEVRRAVIVGAQLRGKTAEITVDFETVQIHLVKDASGAILEGDASAQERVEDRWVFTRDIKTSGPDWKISET